MCRQAAHHKRKKVAAETEAAAVFEKRRDEALAVIDQIDRFQSIAAVLHQQAETQGLGLRFMATKLGVLAVESTSAGLESIDAFSHILSLAVGRMVRTRSDDPELVALLSLPSFGGSYIAQEAERECRKVLARGPTDVILFVAMAETPISPAESPWRSSDEADEDVEVRGRDYMEHKAHDDYRDENEFDPRDEPSSSDPELPEDHGLMDHCDPFWR
jgi:hypothetical protein